MGLFEVKRRQVSDLEREVMAHPTPANMVALAERYMATGNEDKAVGTARKAIDKFPGNENCQSTFQNVRRVQLQAEIQKLNRALRSKPVLKDYERLADIYHREVSNRTKAFEIALDGIQRFPDSDGLKNIAGSIRMDRFHQDFLAKDFTESVSHFEQAAEINPRNYKALASLARLYAEAGDFKNSKEFAELALQSIPGDEVMEHLLKDVVSMLDNSIDDLDGALQDIETARTLGPQGEKIRRIFDPSTRAAGALTVSPLKIEEFLKKFESLNGYKCSVVLTREGHKIMHSRGMVKAEKFAALIEGIWKCSEDASRKMDIGTFVNGTIDTSIGHVMITDLKSVIFGILAGPPAKKADLRAAAEKLTSLLAVS